MRFGVICEISKGMDANNVKVEKPYLGQKWARGA